MKRNSLFRKVLTIALAGVIAVSSLACTKTEDKSKYLGRTCLTLKMAYHNARLLARLDNSWLM